ncbi:Ddhd2 protein [Capsaspora owczarzaki ATCC 30864]|uniref:Ddhd2 protein n=1 Tax=Capsaspora owczarzaki (strain ATCC 30864) TaxID=595528 RepID=UPI0003525D5A|nr:Ddhd2 protein [Capsaspora owczarzaki ATCC 30864]|eukprot:XP_004365423.2 Ddhd2 protein [Capsaspora owczarzaki ATCC 30864]
MAHDDPTTSAVVAASEASTTTTDRALTEVDSTVMTPVEGGEGDGDVAARADDDALTSTQADAAADADAAAADAADVAEHHGVVSSDDGGGVPTEADHSALVADDDVVASSSSYHSTVEQTETEVAVQDPITMQPQSQALDADQQLSNAESADTETPTAPVAAAVHAKPARPPPPVRSQLQTPSSADHAAHDVHAAQSAPPAAAAAPSKLNMIHNWFGKCCCARRGRQWHVCPEQHCAWQDPNCEQSTPTHQAAYGFRAPVPSSAQQHHPPQHPTGSSASATPAASSTPAAPAAPATDAAAHGLAATSSTVFYSPPRTPVKETTAIQELTESQVLWFVQSEDRKKWLPFSQHDSFNLERAYRKNGLHKKPNPARRPSSVGGTPTLPSASPPTTAQKDPHAGDATPGKPDSPSSTSPTPAADDDKDVLVSVRGDLFEVNLNQRTCYSIYWTSDAFDVLRGTWALVAGSGVEWVPCSEYDAEEIETLYSCKPWEAHTTPPAAPEPGHPGIDAPVPQTSNANAHAWASAGGNGSDDLAAPMAAPTPTSHPAPATSASQQAPAAHSSAAAPPLVEHPHPLSDNRRFIIFYSEGDVVLFHNDVTSKVTRAIGQNIGGSDRIGGTQLRRGFRAMDEAPHDCSTSRDLECKPVSHLVLVVHGIGQKLEYCDIISNVADFRNAVASFATNPSLATLADSALQSVLPSMLRPTPGGTHTSDAINELTKHVQNTQHELQKETDSHPLSKSPSPKSDAKSDSKHGSEPASASTEPVSPYWLQERVKFLPIEWRSGTRWDGGLSSTQPTMDVPSVDELTLEGVLPLRTILNNSMLDVLYYMTPRHHETVIAHLTAQLNAVYDLFTARHPNFVSNGGRVSIMGHSLGSILSFDILCRKTDALRNASEDTTETADDLSSAAASGGNNSKAVAPEIAMTPTDSTGNLADLASSPRPKQKRRQQGGKRKGTASSSSDNAAPILTAAAERAQRAVDGDDSEDGKDDTTTTTTTADDADPQLNFDVDHCFLIGSPVGLFTTLRGRRIGHNEGDCFPACRRLYNIFHPYDPVAYRIEPCLSREFVDYKPALVPYHRGGKRFHIDIQEKTQSFKNSVASVMSKFSSVKRFWTRAPAAPADQPASGGTGATPGSADSTAEASEPGPESYSPAQRLIRELCEGGRMDWQLQESTIENQYLSSISSHLSYWGSLDTALFVLARICSKA